MTTFWLTGWAAILSVAWLLPNHYPPWSTFHMDAWTATVLTMAAAAVIVRPKGPAIWHSITVLAALLVLVPGVQYGFGLILSPGTAWISTAYLLGFLLALLTGARWESASPGQLADGLFLAIGISALLSVGLQLHQWLSLDLLDIWSMGDGFGRPFANFGQPNNLGTFLLWGLLATAWGVVRKHLGGGSALFIAAYLTFGLALTQSRTAWVAIVLMICASWFWRHLWPDRRWPWLVTGLGVYFALCLMSLVGLNQLLGLTLLDEASDIVRISTEQRPAVWTLFVDAALQRPWLGYGWNQVVQAQMAVAPEHPPLHTVFAHSHNLFLDLMLWCGIPIGVLVSVCLVGWLWLRLRAVRHAEDAVLMLFLLVVANHAMLELPLHHAYFLLPTGLIVGLVNARQHVRPLFVIGRWSMGVIWLMSAGLLGLLVSDYARIEPSYQALRFEWANIKYQTRGTPPDVLLLSQWREFIRLARYEPSNQMTKNELDWMRQTNSTLPSTGGMHKLAAALAMHKQPLEAQVWLQRACKISSEMQCAALQRAWSYQALQNVDIAAVPWPEK